MSPWRSSRPEARPASRWTTRSPAAARISGPERRRGIAAQARPRPWSRVRLVAVDRCHVVRAQPDPARSGLARGAGEAVVTDGRQPDAGHVAVDRLVLPLTHAVGLVPDADVAGVAHALVERAPGREVAGVAIARVAVEVFERAPVLDER